ncbi:MAG: TolC family protein [Bacteroidales bacterium]|nr:TolC family protein [Bacteroidales bacterium]MCF8389104.1 TolC family protein [Bacteroidales bacterium]
MIRIFLFAVFLFGLSLNSLRAQEEDGFITNLSLRNVVDLAIYQSASVRYAQNTNVNYYWRWQNFRTRFRPQLTLSGDLPNYGNSITENLQDDGSTSFTRVEKLKTSAQLSLNQNIARTGTYVYAASYVNRIQDYNNSTIDFAGTPFSVGFVQPIFAYNWAKWAKKSEPLLYEEANKDFIQQLEEISKEATRRFFRYLTVQTNFKLAESNLSNSRDNLKIADAKKILGQISENDYSRIKLSVLNAQKSLNTARMDLKNADFELKSYIGLEQDQKIALTIPLNMVLFEIDPERALQEAFENRKETPRFERRLIDADRELEEAKRNSGLSATLRGSYGVSNSAYDFPGVYESPDIEQVVRLNLSIPILDWGRSASAIKLAESERDLTIFDVEKDKKDFERSVIVQVEQFSLLKDQMITAEEADKVAENGYLIALKKFQNGEISITDLNISLGEREKAKRDYIDSLQDYWRAYYNLRILTLYDFELDQKISYVNPLLEE